MSLIICSRGRFLPKYPQLFGPWNQKQYRYSSLQQLERRIASKAICVSVASFDQSYLIAQNPTPLSRPLYIEMPEGNPSPYLKQLLSKVGGAEVQFWDFTLEGPNEDDDLDKEQYQQQLPKQKQMSVIEEEQEEEKASPSLAAHAPTFEYNPDEYIPNMHLLDIDPAALKIQHFNETLQNFNHSSDEMKREFISLYLTDQDLDAYKDADTKKLIEVVHSNLSIIGVISRLQRKAKVSRYLQKKKRRIWRKKINYDCRKKVADNRLRVKGKFVTREQACTMLGIEICTQEELKDLLKTNYHKLMF